MASRIVDLCEIGSEVADVDVTVCSQVERVHSVSLLRAWTCVRVETRDRNGCVSLVFLQFGAISIWVREMLARSRINRTGYQHVDPTHARVDVE